MFNATGALFRCAADAFRLTAQRRACYQLHTFYPNIYAPPKRIYMIGETRRAAFGRNAERCRL